ncbi:hypothetical protein GS18_0211165 [Metabacillus indicus]|uniref:DUF5658 domain-containing protein n=2 Tax=Metabacillus indicus TaxID=246786 RepID=A0A084GWG5_METID|nr:hypothetical protein GS18_0211165 [Metabacillus indicus]
MNIIHEVNPLMLKLYSSHPIFFILIKFGLSIILWYLSKFDKVLSSSILKYTVILAIVSYLVVMLLHINWIVYFLEEKPNV